jgi:hypothetical protein
VREIVDEVFDSQGHLVHHDYGDLGGGLRRRHRHEGCHALYPQSAVEGERFELCVVDNCGSECGDLARE